MLASPNFLLRIERDRAAEPERAYRISDQELAVRLSYFLWSSMPDEELSALAAKGELAKPEVLEKQVGRMLADPKARALTDNFAAQWLQLRKVADARPSPEFFPTFTGKLRQAMYDETATFFNKLREEDRSLLELLDADFTYLNADLAKHYGIDGVTGPEFRKVMLADGNRGGLLAMAAPLALTSHTSRTSPTLRGKYVLEVILGTPPPPPPPNVSQIDESKNKGKSPKNFREQLALHATQAACANCHRRIDPLGFGLEKLRRRRPLAAREPPGRRHWQPANRRAFQWPEGTQKDLASGAARAVSSRMLRRSFRSMPSAANCSRRMKSIPRQSWRGWRRTAIASRAWCLALSRAMPSSIGGT